MAEFLIKAIDATNSDPVKDKRGCYKRGDIVVVMPDGHEWGAEEKLPKFVVVKIPELDTKAAQKYIESEIDNTDPQNPIVLSRRKFKLLLDGVPQTVKDELKTKGMAAVSWSQIKSFVQNKVTQAVEL